MDSSIVITGIGMITPLGRDPEVVMRRIESGDSAAVATGFSSEHFACRVCGRVPDFGPRGCPVEPKLARLMNRDAQLAVAAARLALQDANLKVGTDYAPEEIGLFGAVGTAGLPLPEVVPLLRASTTEQGQFDLSRFGRKGLRAVNPVLSFKILGNMSVCFVSIRESIRGPNGVYTPYEGNGAQAIAAGIRAIMDGDAMCALVGGCDGKVDELAFIALQQKGWFDAWRGGVAGPFASEGAVYLVLERRERAARRQARLHAQIEAHAASSQRSAAERSAAWARVWQGLNLSRGIAGLVSTANGDTKLEQAERRALAEFGVRPPNVISPKKHTGDLFAAAAALQVAVGARMVPRVAGPVLVHCFGHGSEQSAFLLSPP